MIAARGLRDPVLAVAASAWAALVGLAVVPFQLRYLGLEAYGLIGFFAALQGVLSILDLGLSPTMSREVARCRALDRPEEARDLLHTLGLIYWCTAGAIALTLGLLAGPIAAGWLRDSSLSDRQLEQAIVLMGLVIALRWPVGVYTGVLVGAERLALASLLNIAFTTVASFGAVAVLATVSPTIEAFFIWQAAASIVYVAALQFAAWRVLGRPGAPRFDVGGLKRIWRFSAGLSFATVLGVVFMQSDKVVLSRLATLEQLGTYTLAGLLARTLYIVLSPTFNLIYPKMTSFLAAERSVELRDYYKTGTRMLTAVILPFAAFVCAFPYEIMHIWTGNAGVAAQVAPLAPFLVLGTALNGVMHFPYALQLAAGKAHLPAVINVVLLVMYVPMFTFLTVRYGLSGAAASWAVLNGGYVLLGTWLTHRAILPGEGWRWLRSDVGLTASISAAVAFGGGLLVQRLDAPELVRLTGGVILAAIAFLFCLLTLPRSLIGRVGLPGFAGLRTTDLA